MEQLYMYVWDVETFYLVYVVYDEEIVMVATEGGQKLENMDQSICSKYWLAEC